MSALEERVARLESAVRGMKWWSRVKNAIYAVIIIGVVVYAYNLYSTSGEWKAEVADRPKLGLASPTQLTVTVPVKVYNPDGSVFARLVYYKVYIEGYYAGDGLIPYLDLPPGWSEHKVTLTLDLDRAGCGVAKALSSRSNVTVRVEGYMMVDLKAFGVITWKTVTLPFNTTAAEVGVPQLPSEAASLLKLYTLACDKAPELLNALSKLAGSLPIPGSGSQGSGGSGAPVEVELNVTRSLLGYTLKGRITNTAGSPVTIDSIKVNGRDVAGIPTPITLQPGDAIEFEATSLTSTFTVEVTVNGQTYTYTKTYTG